MAAVGDAPLRCIALLDPDPPAAAAACSAAPGMVDRAAPAAAMSSPSAAASAASLAVALTRSRLSSCPAYPSKFKMTGEGLSTGWPPGPPVVRAF